MTGDLKFIEKVYRGSGAPVTDDQITKDTSQYPIGTHYTDETNGAIYVRTGTGKVTGDWTSLGSSSPGGDSGILSVTVTLDNDEIKNLPTTPIEIIEAPGAGKIILPISGFVVAYYDNGNEYTDIDDAALHLFSNSVGRSLYMNASTLLGTSNSPFAQFAFPLFYQGGGGLSSQIITDVDFDLGDVENYGLSIKDGRSGFADPVVTVYGGGNAANTMKVTVYYVIADL